MISLDCSGLNCPLPILRLSKAANAAPAGETIELIATDPGSVKDVAAWSKQTGNLLTESSQESGRFRFLVVKQ